MSGQDRPWMIEDEIRALIYSEVVTAIRGKIPEMYESIKTVMIEYFSDCYTTLCEAAISTATTAVAAAGVRGEQAFQYREFDNTKP